MNMRGDGIYCALSHEKIPARRECVPYRYLVVASQLVPTEQPGCNRGGFSALCEPPCISPVILFREEKKGVFPWLSVESFPSCGLVPLISDQSDPPHSSLSLLLGVVLLSSPAPSGARAGA